MNNVAYLIQGARHKLLEATFPEGASIYMLCYDDEVPVPGTSFLFDPHCTWAEGRNKLATVAATNPAHEYFVFCDDDCRFLKGGLREFEALLLKHQPLVAQPVMPKAKMCDQVLEQSVQAAVVIDEQMYAVHRSVLGHVGISPIVTDYDAKSWYAACLILEHEALARYPQQVMQFNSIEIDNLGHSADTPGSKYVVGDWDQYWPEVESWLRSNGGYVRGIHEPIYPQFFYTPERKTALMRLRNWLKTRSRTALDRHGQAITAE